MEMSGRLKDEIDFYPRLFHPLLEVIENRSCHDEGEEPFATTANVTT